MTEETKKGSRVCVPKNRTKFSFRLSSLGDREDADSNTHANSWKETPKILYVFLSFLR